MKDINIKMKKILITLLLITPIFLFSQKNKIDSNIICFPYKVAKQIALDLNGLDSITELYNLTKIELNNTNFKIDFQKDIINLMEKKEKNYELQIKKENEKYIIVEKENNGLKKEVKKLKVKVLFIEILGGAIITSLTLLTILK